MEISNKQKKFLKSEVETFWDRKKCTGKELKLRGFLNKMAYADKVDIIRQLDAENEDYINNWHDSKFDEYEDKADYYEYLANLFHNSVEGIWDVNAIATFSGFSCQALNIRTAHVAITANYLAELIRQKGYDDEEVKYIEYALKYYLKEFRQNRVGLVETIVQMEVPVATTEMEGSISYNEYGPVVKPFSAKDVFRMDSADDFDIERALKIFGSEYCEARPEKNYKKAILQKHGKCLYSKGVDPRIDYIRTKSFLNVNDAKEMEHLAELEEKLLTEGWEKLELVDIKDMIDF